MIIMDNIVLEAIRTRRSIRKYTPEQVSEDLLTSVLEAGSFAATGHNSQDPLIVAVQNPEINARLRKMNAEIMGMGGDPYYGAPTIVLVFVPKPEVNPNSVQDGSLVLGNMMLAAHSLGLASCWINREKEMFATPEGRKLKAELGVPEEYMGIGALALGHPAIANPKALPRKENYWKIVK
jgi:nitroreductase